MQEFISELQTDLIFGRGIHDDFQITEHLAGSWSMHDHTSAEELSNEVIKCTTEILNSNK
jgi:hypothetical protein